MPQGLRPTVTGTLQRLTNPTLPARRVNIHIRQPTTTDTAISVSSYHDSTVSEEVSLYNANTVYLTHGN